MKNIFVFFIVLITCFTVKGILRRALTPAKESRHPGAFRLPADLRAKDIPKLRIPNSELCNQLKLDPAQNYILLPWWYQHCQDLKERKAKKYNSKYENLQFYLDAIKRVDDIKKMARKRQYN